MHLCQCRICGCGTEQGRYCHNYLRLWQYLGPRIQDTVPRISQHLVVGKQSINPHKHLFTPRLGTVPLYPAHFCQQRSRDLARSCLQFAGHSSQEKQTQINYSCAENGLIEQLVAIGCSFTRGTHGATWANHLDISSVANLANDGAGNSYICRRTLNYLESHNHNPKKTLVIVMWSGASRIDVSVSSEWYNHIKTTFKFGQSDGVSNWIHTGSSGNVPILENLCKTNDNQSLCVDSLQNFILLENYLRARGYSYLFTSYANYWNEEQEYCATTEVDPNIGYHCKNLSLYKNFDFSNWSFVNDKQDCFGEFALDDIRNRDDAHPSPDTHQRFATEILLPAIRKFQ